MRWGFGSAMIPQKGHWASWAFALSRRSRSMSHGTTAKASCPSEVTITGRSMLAFKEARNSRMDMRRGLSNVYTV